MFFKPGIKIFTKLPSVERIKFSEGIQIAETINGIPCDHRTFVPRMPWREPTLTELSQLIAKKDTEAKVAIFKLPWYLQRKISRSGIQTATSQRNLDNIKQEPLYNSAYSSLLKYVSLFQHALEKPVNSSIGHGPTGLANSSFNFKKETYVGLHVDSWDMQPLDSRHLSRNRILINLGKDPRYFLFVNQEVRDLINFTTKIESTVNDSFDSTFQYVQRFFEENPFYPVIKVKLNPFEGYVAPTDNIIHDGNTEGQKTMDVFFTSRSFYNTFPRSAFASLWKKPIKHVCQNEK